MVMSGVQIESNRIESNQIKSHQIESNRKFIEHILGNFSQSWDWFCVFWVLFFSKHVTLSDKSETQTLRCLLLISVKKFVRSEVIADRQEVFFDFQS